MSGIFVSTLATMLEVTPRLNMEPSTEMLTEKGYYNIINNTNRLLKVFQQSASAYDTITTCEVSGLPRLAPNLIGGLGNFQNLFTKVVQCVKYLFHSAALLCC